MLFFTGIQSWLQKIGRIFLLIINLDNQVHYINDTIAEEVLSLKQQISALETEISSLSTNKPMNVSLQKAYYGINGTLYSFDGKTFSNVLTLTNADVDTPNYISGMSLLCTINGLSYFNINGNIYSFDGSIFMRADTLLLPDGVTPNNVTSRSFIGVI